MKTVSELIFLVMFMKREPLERSQGKPVYPP